MGFSTPTTTFLSFLINQKSATINLTSVTFTQTPGLDFVPSLLISYSGDIYISNLKFKFSSTITTRDYLIIVTQGNFTWRNSANRFFNFYKNANL